MYPDDIQGDDSHQTKLILRVQLYQCSGTVILDVYYILDSLCFHSKSLFRKFSRFVTALNQPLLAAVN